MAALAAVTAAVPRPPVPPTNRRASPSGAVSSAPPPGRGTGEQSKFFVQADYDAELALLDADADGPGGQAVGAGARTRDGGHRQVQEGRAVQHLLLQRGAEQPVAAGRLEDHAGRGRGCRRAASRSSPPVDAEGKDDKQISDIADLLGKGCDALIVSPNTTATLTPAVEAACSRAAGHRLRPWRRHRLPGDVHQPHRRLRLRRTSAPSSSPRRCKPGGKVLALRILPGVDVLETRWSAAKVAFDKAKVDVVGVEFTDGDPAKTKKIVDDYIQRYGTIDGVWMDAGAAAVAAVEAFQDAGKPVPPINGEDQLRLPEDVEGQEAHRDRADLPDLPVAYADHRGAADPRRRAGVQPVEAAAADHHPGQPRPVPRRRTCRRCTTRMCGCKDLPGYPQRWK